VAGQGIVTDDDPNSEYSLRIDDKHEFVSFNGAPVIDLKESRISEVIPFFLYQEFMKLISSIEDFIYLRPQK